MQCSLSVRRVVVTTLAGALVAGGVGMGGCGGGSSAPNATPTPVTASTFPAPWQRTEVREPCMSFDPLRAPFFGDLHVHTKYSADASIFGTKVGPREAYDFARGGRIPVSDANEQPTRMAQIDRPLDFTAVTDHAEWFGEVLLCLTPGSAAYNEDICQLLRQPDDPADQFLVTVQWLFPAGIPNPPPALPFCSDPGVDCGSAAVSVWQEMQAAAEAAYDRSAACTFTSFIGYEHTPSPGGRHQHRNVIFRNAHVPAFASSQLDTAADGFPQGLWLAIERDCLNAGIGCDAVIIPHNSNLSDGQQFVDPLDASDAQRRQNREPLVEIHQQKGNSECRFDRLAGMGVGTADEFCTFEQLPGSSQVPGQPPPPIDQYPPRNLVRNALKDGLLFEDMLGVNPFKFGFIGDTDTHNATAGNVDEANWYGDQGNNDATPARQIGDAMSNNPGGLAVVWAEENSRDAIFAALRRRETYATSGTRPVVRFFGGALADVGCGDADLVARAYRTGTPMGGDLGPVRGSASPRFAVLAARDPGTASAPGTALQRVQIVKGWVDGNGQTQEKVFDVAGDPNNKASVDPATCAPVGRGADQLCRVWEDPDFDRTQRAFYYVRVLENPTCRWSTRVCKLAGVDPFAADCAAQAAAADPAFAACCLRAEDDPFLSPIIQERAWTSPIWYRPEGIAAVTGGVQFGAQPGTDRLALTVRIGQMPPGVDLVHTDLTIGVTDNDDIYHVTIPAGALQADGSDRYTLPAEQARADGLETAGLERLSNGELVLTLQTVPLDLSAADRVDHQVEVSLAAGTYRTTQMRTWLARSGRLAPVAD